MSACVSIMDRMVEWVSRWVVDGMRYASFWRRRWVVVFDGMVGFANRIVVLCKHRMNANRAIYLVIFFL